MSLLVLENETRRCRLLYRDDVEVVRVNRAMHRHRRHRRMTMKSVYHRLLSNELN